MSRIVTLISARAGVIVQGPCMGPCIGPCTPAQAGFLRLCLIFFISASEESSLQMKHAKKYCTNFLTIFDTHGTIRSKWDVLK